MITTEDILAALAGRTFWVSTGIDDRRRGEFRKYADVMQRLENSIRDIYSRDREAVRRPAEATAKGKQSRSGRPLTPFGEIVNNAIARMPRVYWHAILWVIDGDESAHADLYSRLVATARNSAKRDGFWPARIQRSPCLCGHFLANDYVPDLAQLALMELRTPALFATHSSRASWFGLSERHWHRIGSRPYGILQGKTFEWLGSGCAHIERRLGARRRVENTD